MPTYQYACTECGEQHEAVQAFSDPALTECPRCSGRLRKVFSSVGVVFKGSGFYRNDSRPGEKTTEKVGDSAETKADAKPAADSGTSKPADSSSSSSTSTSSSSNSSSSGTGSSSGTSSSGGTKAGAAAS